MWMDLTDLTDTKVWGTAGADVVTRGGVSPGGQVKRSRSMVSGSVKFAAMQRHGDDLPMA